MVATDGLVAIDTHQQSHRGLTRLRDDVLAHHLLRTRAPLKVDDGVLTNSTRSDAINALRPWYRSAWGQSSDAACCEP